MTVGLLMVLILAADAGPAAGRDARPTCAVRLPDGWTAGRPMPDHLLELWSNAPGVPPRAELIVKETQPAAHLEEAVRRLRSGARRAWGDDVRLVSEEPITGAMRGVLVKHEASQRDGGPPRTHWVALYLVEGRVIQALVYPQDARDTPALRQVLTSLDCGHSAGAAGK